MQLSGQGHSFSARCLLVVLHLLVPPAHVRMVPVWTCMMEAICASVMLALPVQLVIQVSSVHFIIIVHSKKYSEYHVCLSCIKACILLSYNSYILVLCRQSICYSLGLSLHSSDALGPAVYQRLHRGLLGSSQVLKDLPLNFWTTYRWLGFHVCSLI